MTLSDPQGELWAGQKAWAIEMAPDNVRLIAEAFQAPEGLVFADTGWNDPFRSGHPFHFVPGEVTAVDTGFQVGSFRIVEIPVGHPLYPAWSDWLTWKSRGGGTASRASCRRAIEAEWIHYLEPDRIFPPR